MPMNNRLLRPRASAATGFTPQQIAGLGVWLDATDAASYTESSGQVSEWRDKSGNSRHFQQTTANHRPTLFTSSADTQTTTPATINGVQGLFFDGSNDQLVGSTATLSVLSSAPGCTVFIASRWLGAGATGGSIYNIQARATFSVFNTATGGIYKSASRDGTSQVGLQNGGAIASPTNYIFRHAVDYQLGQQAVFANGVIQGGTGAPGGGTGLAVSSAAAAFRIGALNASSNYYPGIIGELLVYNRPLLISEVASVESYLSAKWGISVPAYTPPAYADADVNAYISAVESADGLALETGVRDAINTFITGCKSDGIWSAIKSSCILMGARSLAGALTPLVGTAPTNVNFVSGDYARKTGLVGNGTTKYLNTNRANNADPEGSQHLATYLTTIPSALGVCIGAGGASSGASSVQRSGDNTTGARSRNATYQTSGIDMTLTTAGLWGKSRSSTGAFTLRFANSANTKPSAFSVSSQSPSTDSIFAFARNNGSGTPEAHGNMRMAYYSIGEGLNLDTLDTRVSALYTAIGAAIP